MVTVVTRLKAAVQVIGAFTVTCPSVQSGSPDHPLKADPFAGVAVSVTTVPSLYVSEQSAPQLMPLPSTPVLLP